MVIIKKYFYRISQMQRYNYYYFFFFITTGFIDNIIATLKEKL